jgi:hypothetical protein
MIPEIANKMVKILSTLKTYDMSDIRLALVVLVSAVKNRQPILLLSFEYLSIN